MGAGWQRSGVNAFIPGDINYYDLGGPNMQGFQHGETDVVNHDRDNYRSFMADQLSGLAGQLGYDTSGYDLSDGYTPAYDQHTMDQYAAIGRPLPTQKKTMDDLYNDMNKDLSNFQRIRGASAGWDGKGNIRSTAEALYHQSEPGLWSPVTNPQSGVKQKHKGWAREEGADTIAALSVMLPAFGGWAGILGQGAAGTLTAGSGLGLTGALPAAAVNAGMGALVSGNTAGALGALGGAAGGIGGQYLGNMAGGFGTAGQILGSQVGRQVGQKLA